MTGPFLHALNEEEFFSQIHDRIAYVAKKRIHSQDYEDVVQSTMIELRSRVQDVTDSSKILTLVFEILRNFIREYYQQKKRDNKVLDFSPDALYYYQSETSEEMWQDISQRALAQLETEHPRCAEIIRAVLKSSSLENLSRKFEMEAFNIHSLLFRCRNSLLKVITEKLKIPLP